MIKGAAPEPMLGGMIGLGPSWASGFARSRKTPAPSPLSCGLDPPEPLVWLAAGLALRRGLAAAFGATHETKKRTLAVKLSG